MRFTFDPPETGWSPNPSASIIADITAPTQPSCLQMRWGVGSDPLCVRTITGLTVGLAQPLYVLCAFDRLSGDDPYITIRFEFSDGSVFETQIFKSSLIDENGDQLHGWQFASGVDLHLLAVMDIPTTAATLRILGSHAPGHLVSARIDSIYIGEAPPNVAEEMSKRRSIREAIVTAVGAVTVTNGYALTIAKVNTGPTRIPDGMDGPIHVSIMHGEEAKTLRTLTALGMKDCQVSFVIGVACKRTDTANPDDQCDDACGEIEKALELFSNGQWLGLGYVRNVFVSNVNPEELPPEIARDLAAWTMTVDVAYTHERRNP